MKNYKSNTIKLLTEDSISCHNCYRSIENFWCPIPRTPKNPRFLCFSGGRGESRGWGAPKIKVCPPQSQLHPGAPGTYQRVQEGCKVQEFHGVPEGQGVPESQRVPEDQGVLELQRLLRESQNRRVQKGQGGPGNGLVYHVIPSAFKNVKI